MATLFNSTRRKTGAAFFFGSLSLAGASLGSWQVQRWKWKTQVIDEQHTLFREPPLSTLHWSRDDFCARLPLIAAGRQLQLTGRFDHSREVLLGLRACPSTGTGQQQGMSSSSMGYQVITPLIVTAPATATATAEDGKQEEVCVFVNRGWVPKSMAGNSNNNNSNMSWERPAGEQQLCVVMSAPEKNSFFSPVNNPSSGTLIWLEEAALKTACRMEDVPAAGGGAPVLPVVVVSQLGAAGGGAGEAARHPLPLSADCETKSAAHYVTPETHVAYAATWFALSLAAGIICFSKIRRRQLPRNSKLSRAASGGDT